MGIRIRSCRGHGKLYSCLTMSTSKQTILAMQSDCSTQGLSAYPAVSHQLAWTNKHCAEVRRGPAQQDGIYILHKITICMLVMCDLTLCYCAKTHEASTSLTHEAVTSMTHEVAPHPLPLACIFADQCQTNSPLFNRQSRLAQIFLKIVACLTCAAQLHCTLQT